MSQTDDHGLEVLKKAAEYTDPASITKKKDYYLKIGGAPTGSTYTLPPVSVVGDFQSTPSGLKNGGLITELIIDDTAWFPVPTTPLVDRNSLGFQNTTTFTLKLNFSTPSGFVGWQVIPGGEFFLDITDDILLYAKMESGAGSNTITVMEIS